jgi:hypothetical protein
MENEGLACRPSFEVHQLGGVLWRIKDGSGPMWHGAMVKEAGLPSWVQPDCCAAAVVGGSCRWPTVATMAEYPATFVEAIEEIANRAGA